MYNHAPHTDAAILVRRPEKHGIMRVVEVYDAAAAALNTYLTYHRPVLLGQTNSERPAKTRTPPW